MAKQTLFNVLKVSPWWMSAVVAGAVFLAARMIAPDYVAFFASLPFLVVAVYAGWRQLRTPSESKVGEAMANLRAMSWEEFSALMAEAFRRDGYDVAASPGKGADLQLRKSGRLALASCRRWKVAQSGLGPIKELLDALEQQDANDALFVTASDLTPNARDYAVDHAVRVVTGAELLQLVQRVRKFPIRKR
jgi:restriction system protein